MYVCMYVCVCMYNGHSESSKPHPERRILAEHFNCGNTLPLIKQEKTNSNLCFSFCTGEADIKVIGVQQT